ncbi:MAG: type II toxin-antitoxin system Phd/YefM family antitoxin [Planctomycetota bacterium]|jgi:hypothetical protein|nr:type II toxin-antitoxin system Phd/YefM family antitoxin [Planctomycetota bacterium]
MKGVSYLVDEAGNKTAVILNLRDHRRLWEDIHDRLLIASRQGERRESLAQVRKRLSRRAAKAHA